MSRKEYERATVSATAMAVFWAKGYQGASVQLLCDATGLNRKTLYSEFGDKRSLFLEALALYTSGALAQSKEALAKEPLGKENLRQYFKGMSYEPNCRGCLMTMTVNERGQVPEDGLDLVASSLADIEALFVANLAAGGVDAVASARLAAFLVFSIQGITTMGKLEADNDRLAAVIETILAVLD